MGQNVWVKSGTVRTLFTPTEATGTGVTSTATSKWNYKDSPDATFQAVVTGTGAVTATVVIEMSNDGVNALETAAGTITLSGTTTSTDGFTTSNAPWKYARARITAISGTGAIVQVYMGV